MAAPAIFALPYHVARTPLAVLDMTVLQRLPEDSPVRRGFAKAFGSLDLVAGRVFADQSLLRQGAERLAAAAPGRPGGGSAESTSAKRPAATRPSSGSSNGNAGASVPENLEEAGPQAFGPAPEKKAARNRPAPAAKAAPSAPSDEAPQAAQARDEVITQRQPANARANKNLSTIRQQLAQTDAIADAHEHLAEERAEEHPEDGSAGSSAS